MKGQISLIEAILAAVALFIAFNIMIPSGEYSTKWKEAINAIEGRDILITADRLGKLHEYAFSASFKTEFLNRLDSIKDAIVRSETQDTLQNTVYIACKCTSDQVTYLQNTLSEMKFNKRGITAVVCNTALSTINTCGSSATYPNSLVIWGYNDLTSNVNTLLNFLNDGNGLIEIADIPNSKVDGGADDDEGQKRIFGLTAISEGNFPSNLDEFIKPVNASQLPYQSYKWFYHLPYLLKGTVPEAVPVEGGIPPCSSSLRGEFKFQAVNHKFWICGASVYWDTNNNDVADIVVTERNTFSIGSSNFFLNYIDSADKIRVSFKPDYRFNDFIVLDNTYNKLAVPIPDNKTRALLSMGFWDLTQEKPIAAVIFNGTENYKTAWVADFSRGGLTNTGDDHKQLLASLVFSVANKKTEPTLQQTGQITSYINVNTTDMLEIYKIDLSVGEPF